MDIATESRHKNEPGALLLKEIATNQFLKPVVEHYNKKKEGKN
jgi:hypothetical protein